MISITAVVASVLSGMVYASGSVPLDPGMPYCQKFRIANEFVGKGCEPLGGCVSASGMNDSADVVGRFACLDNHAFRWSHESGFELVEVSGASSTRADAISSDGVIVGDAVISGASGAELRVFVFDGEKAVVLANPENALSAELVAINDSGFAVGSWVDLSDSRRKPLGLSGGRLLDMSDELPDDYQGGFTDLNEAGQSVGWMGTHQLLDARAFIREASGELVVLEPAAGAVSSYGRGISTNGDVAGVSYFDFGGVFPSARAMIWSDSDGHLLEEYGVGGHEFAEDLNAEGVVIGNVAPTGMSSVPVVWFEQRIFLLENLVVEARGLSLHRAIQIDDEGRVLVTGSRVGLGSCAVFILEPIGGPSPDLNDDRAVDSQDLLSLIQAWGDGASMTDLTCDGHTGMDDLLILLSHWGTVQ